jgi:hypothetical protein
MPKKNTPLTPPDKERCQADVPNGNSFMTLGGRPGRVRCSNIPVVIAKENKAGEDGRKGSMSLCEGCSQVFIGKMGVTYATMTPIKKPKTKRVPVKRERSSRGTRIDGSTRMGE